MDSREQFEKWWPTIHWSKARTRTAYKDVSADAWQASREAAIEECSDYLHAKGYHSTAKDILALKGDKEKP